MNVHAAKRCLVVAAVAMLLAGTAGCGMLQRPSARITGVKLRDVRTTDATMLFDVRVENPYTFALPISNVDYKLSSRGQQFLTGDADVQGTVPPEDSETVGVPVRISYVELINTVKGARPGATIPYRADLGLSLDAGALGRLRVPLSKEGELSIPSTGNLLDRLRDMAQ